MFDQYVRIRSDREHSPEKRVLIQHSFPDHRFFKVGKKPFYDGEVLCVCRDCHVSQLIEQVVQEGC